jgi:hypothetical protein
MTYDKQKAKKRKSKNDTGKKTGVHNSRRHFGDSYRSHRIFSDNIP